MKKLMLVLGLILVFVVLSYAEPRINITDVNYTVSENITADNCSITVNITSVILNNTGDELNNTTWYINISRSWDSNTTSYTNNTTLGNYTFPINYTTTYNCSRHVWINITFHANWTNTTNNTTEQINASYVLESPHISNLTASFSPSDDNLNLSINTDATNKTLYIYNLNNTSRSYNETLNNSTETIPINETHWGTGKYKIIVMVNNTSTPPSNTSWIPAGLETEVNVFPDLWMSNVSANKSVNITGNGVTINITDFSLVLHKTGLNYTDEFANKTINITVSDESKTKQFVSVNVNNTTLENNSSINLSNSSLYFTHDSPGDWYLDINISGVPDHNGENNTVRINSTYLEITSNAPEEDGEYYIINETNLTLTINASNIMANGLNISLDLYKRNGSSWENTTSRIWNNSTNSTISWDWNHTFNSTGEYEIIVVARGGDSLPSWNKAIIHVESPINISSLRALGINFTYLNGTTVNSSVIPANLTLKMNLTNSTGHMTLKGNISFSRNITSFLTGVKWDKSNKLAKYDFNVDNSKVHFVGWLNVTNMSELGIHSSNLTVYHCSSTCSELTNYKMTSSGGIVEEVDIPITSFSSYIINETSSSSSSSNSGSSGSSGSGGGGASGGGGGGTLCKYNSKLLAPSEIVAYLGTKNVFHFTVQNKGTCADLITPRLEGIPDSWYTITPESIKLDVDEEYQFTLEITPKQTGNFTARLEIDNSWQTLAIHVKKKEEEKKKAEIKVNTTSIILETGNNTTVGKFTLENSGNADANVSIKVTGNVSSILSLPTQITVNAGEKKTITFQVPPVNKTYSGQIEITAENETYIIPITIKPKQEKKIETGKTGSSLLLGIIIGALIVVAIIVTVLYYLYYQEKPKGGLASVKPYYKPKHIKRSK